MVMGHVVMTPSRIASLKQRNMMLLRSVLERRASSTSVLTRRSVRRYPPSMPLELGIRRIDGDTRVSDWGMKTQDFRGGATVDGQRGNDLHYTSAFNEEASARTKQQETARW